MYQICIRLAGFLLVAISMIACSSGGGNGDGSTIAPPKIDELGSYTKEEFDYVSPYADDFHPIGLNGIVLTRKEELMILNSPGSPPDQSRATLFDDIGAGADVLGEISDIAGSATYMAGAAGLLDDDAPDELAMIRRETAQSLEVLTIETDANGSYGVTNAFTIASEGFDILDVQLLLADVDGDFRDEYVISARDAVPGGAGTLSWLRVYDDNINGNQRLYDLPFTGSHPEADIVEFSLAADDLDGDGREEVGVLALRGSGARTVQIQVFEQTGSQFVNRIPWGNVFTGQDSRGSSIRLITGDFDGDEIAELVVGAYNNPFGLDRTEARLKRYRVEPGKVTLTASPTITMERNNRFPSTGTVTTFNFERFWDIAAMSINPQEADVIAVLLPEAEPNLLPSQADIVTLEWDGANWQEGFSFVAIPDIRNRNSGLPAGLFVSATLHATDDDGDGQDEIYLVNMSATSVAAGNGRRRVARLDWDNQDNPVTQTWASTVPNPLALYRPVVASPELDSDGMVAEYTGTKYTSLADPIRMVAMAAPPTKAGIDQNYDDTASYYSEASSRGVTHGAITGTNIAAITGFDISDISNSFGVAARVTLSNSVTKSRHETVTVTETQGFTGPPMQDSIVFQGTLYQVYEYRIIASEDENIIGAIYALNVPVKSRVYFWSVDYYNSRVRQEYQIGSDVFSHTVGDPATYPNQNAMQGLTQKYVGYNTIGAINRTVGKTNGGTTDVAISLANEVTTSTERTWSVDAEVVFEIANNQVGGAVGLSDSSVYSVTITEESTYQGIIGNIGSDQDYENWAYDYGLGVYTFGLLADENNQPVGSENNIAPFQVVNYFTEPFGFEY